ncbi:Lipopolysaccharide-modifying protein [Penicillium verhagenii]|uniref:Lipopolysaccharide-modifying protein n=1 Tax=Penicillium verhagenii TaxID=1562060 RepID=UPI002545BB39|nr:Lipopolysaccharide-modifying protein [Penicillium verhagenii]KAJ5935223.1 Lipopolysaccharide-modifying protein [Penicillium verhagenii]
MKLKHPPPTVDPEREFDMKIIKTPPVISSHHGPGKADDSSKGNSSKEKPKSPRIISSPIPPRALSQDRDWEVVEPFRLENIQNSDGGWKNDLTWDLDTVQALHELLAQWTALGVTASHMGVFLEAVLYKQDEHLAGHVTQMVECHAPHFKLALDLLKHYQIRDATGKPLWDLDQSQYGDEDSRAGYTRPPNSARTPNAPLPTSPTSSGPSTRQSTSSEPGGKSRPSRPKIKITLPFFRRSSPAPPSTEPQQTEEVKRNSWYYHVPAPKPLRIFKQPSFMNDVEPSPEVDTPGEDVSGTVSWSFNISEDLTMLSIAERRALMANTGALPPSFAAEIIDSASVMDMSSLVGTNISQIQAERQCDGGSRFSGASYSSSDYGD